MKPLIVLLAAGLAAAMSGAAAEPRGLFSEPFSEKLSEGWTWMRENPANWRLRDGALEIQARPGNANTAENILLRPVPDAGGAALVVETTLALTAAPTGQYEQAGLVWFSDGKPVFKLVHELIDGRTFIIPGRVPTDRVVVDLRLRVAGTAFTAEFRQDGETEWRTVAKGELKRGARNEIGIQTYHGPPEGDRWMRFSRFCILAEDK